MGSGGMGSDSNTSGGYGSGMSGGMSGGQGDSYGVRLTNRLTLPSDPLHQLIQRSPQEAWDRQVWDRQEWEATP